MSSCIITGGSGFIGAHLIEYLNIHKKFDKIIVLDLQPMKRENTGIVEYRYCDIRQPITFDLPDDISTCYHLAALCKEPGFEWQQYFETNYIGTQNVCNLATRLNILNIIFTSTMMVFQAGDKRNNENDLKAPDTAYGMSKLLAEHVLQESATSAPNHRIRIVRPGVVFGKGEGANYTRLYHALKKRRFAYIGRRSTVKGSIYVKDLVSFLDFISDDSFCDTAYNLVYPEPTTIENICSAMCEVFGFSSKIPTVPYKPALLAGYFFEVLDALGVKTGIHHRRIQKLFYSTDISADRAMSTGFRLAYSLQEALRDWQQDCLPDDLY